MPRLLRTDLPFAVAGSDDTADGLHAETRADGSVASVILRQGGRVVARIRVSDDEASIESVEHFASFADAGGSDGGDGFETWIETALRDLSRRADGVRTCAFCEKTSAEVAKLIMGPRQGICNECIALCNDILAANPPSAA
jgi:hypothetical protein